MPTFVGRVQKHGGSGSLACGHALSQIKAHSYGGSQDQMDSCQLIAGKKLSLKKRRANVSAAEYHVQVQELTLYDE